MIPHIKRTPTKAPTMLPTPSPVDRDGSVRRVLGELNCNEVRRAIRRLTKLSLADGPACASAPVGGRKRARSLRRQGATFPSSYAPPMLVPQEVQDVAEHMRRAVRLDHPAAAEQAALPSDCAVALRTMLGEGTAQTCTRREQAMRRVRDVAADLAGVRARVDAAKPAHVQQMPQQCDVPLLYCLAVAAGCPDSSALAVGMACGFEAVNDIEPSGWWDIDVTPASRDIDEERSCSTSPTCLWWSRSGAETLSGTSCPKGSGGSGSAVSGGSALTSTLSSGIGRPAGGGTSSW